MLIKLADSLIGMSTHPEENQAKRDAIRRPCGKPLRKSRCVLWKNMCFGPLIDEGVPGLHRRLQNIMHLMSNTYQLGIIIQSDYLHLSRSSPQWRVLYGAL